MVVLKQFEYKIKFMKIPVLYLPFALAIMLGSGLFMLIFFSILDLGNILILVLLALIEGILYFLNIVFWNAFRQYDFFYRKSFLRKYRSLKFISKYQVDFSYLKKK